MNESSILKETLKHRIAELREHLLCKLLTLRAAEKDIKKTKVVLAEMEAQIQLAEATEKAAAEAARKSAEEAGEPE